MSLIQFDKPRSMSAEALVRELRSSAQCRGLEILLWEEEITVGDGKSGAEVTIRVEASRVELETGGSKRDLAEKVAGALSAQGLRRRPPPGTSRAKRFNPRPGRPPEVP
ncbi:MAG TPA: hypothetical protein VK661_00020 [Planctomycetota bacterium]|jgi:hypothetical protein|nr:hypothetical protein [Planctomycetota bacterium]